MIRLRLAIQLHYQVQPPGGDFVFHLHAAFTPRQRVVSESLHFSQPLAYTLESSPPSSNRVLRTGALPGADAASRLRVIKTWPRTAPSRWKSRWRARQAWCASRAR